MNGGMSGARLLVNVAAWLTVNGMKSENMQFRMLCHQSVDNVLRKRAYTILTSSYKELTQLAFADRVKELAAVTAAMASGNEGLSTELDSLFDGSRKLFADDMADIQSVMKGDAQKEKEQPLVGIEKIQKCLDVLGERVDFTVQNHIPIARPLSEIIRVEVDRNREFIINDYDKAVIDKIVMVLVNSENLAKNRLGAPTAAEEEEEKEDHNLQK